MCFLFKYWGDMFPLVFFAPVVEPDSPTAFISDVPLNLVKEKRGSDVPVLFSYAIDEGLCGAGGKTYFSILSGYIYSLNWTIWCKIT